MQFLTLVRKTQHVQHVAAAFPQLHLPVLIVDFVFSPQLRMKIRKLWVSGVVGISCSLLVIFCIAFKQFLSNFLYVNNSFVSRI